MSTTAPTEENISTPFVCDCEEWVRSACAGEGFYKEHDGKRYCVLHYPDKEKVDAFNVALKRKLDAQDFNFRGVWFPDWVRFKDFHFNADADFFQASFSAGASFGEARFSADASFSGAGFSGSAYFYGARFSAGASFGGARFSADASFSGARFSADTSFESARFSADASFFQARFSADASFFRASFSADASFESASFSADASFFQARFSADADFSRANFAAYVRFVGDEGERGFGKHSKLNLEHARVEKPERVSFHSLVLKPHWFINVDARKFEFVNVEWSTNLKQEIEELRNKYVSSPPRLLSITYRQLAVNAEENHRYGEAAEFRYASMDIRRLEWLQGRKLSGFQFLHWLYWIASGYGERVTRAVVTLFALLVVFACLYTRIGFERKAYQTNVPQVTAIATQEEVIGRPLFFKDALIYSLNVMSLQKPEPKPLTRTAKFLVTLETILGPIQAALLALAIRRRFMR